ncbi:MAG: TrfB-related DNA-binding protein [Casimicrobium sp.]
MKTNKRNPGAKTRPERAERPISALISAVSAEHLEQVLEDTRLSESNKEIAREVLVRRKAMRDVAKEQECSPERVSSVVRRVRPLLAKKPGTTTWVALEMELPLRLAEELRGFTAQVRQQSALRKADVDEAIEAIVKTIVVARTKMFVPS